MEGQIIPHVQNGQIKTFEDEFKFIVDYYTSFDPHETKFYMFRDFKDLFWKKKIINTSSTFNEKESYSNNPHLNNMSPLYEYVDHAEYIRFNSTRSLGYKLFKKFLEDHHIFYKESFDYDHDSPMKKPTIWILGYEIYILDN